MDLGLPPRPDDPTEGLQLLEEVHALAPETKVIVLTGQNDRANALKAIALGAYDFCEKPFEPAILTLMLERAFRLHDLQEENRRLQTVQQTPAMAGIVTRDPGMQRICRTVEKIAPTSATLLILGESGTGKELLARALHDLSPRKGNRFVAINCAAIPETLLESELFGYEKGAFTGAAKQTIGKFETAHGGTLFLDEIGDLSIALQSNGSEGGKKSRSTSGLSAPPIRISRISPQQGSFARICIIDWPRSCWRSLRCARARETRRSSRTDSCTASAASKNGVR
jgi:two-component system NtrC family response regulator